MNMFAILTKRTMMMIVFLSRRLPDDTCDPEITEPSVDSQLGQEPLDDGD